MTTRGDPLMVVSQCQQSSRTFLDYCAAFDIMADAFTTAEEAINARSRARPLRPHRDRPR